MKKPTIYMITGYAGAGKSTVAKQLSKKLGIKSFTTDKIRRLKEFEKQYNKYRQAGTNFHWTFRKKLHLKLLELAETELKNNKDVILDATLSRIWVRNIIKKFARKMNAKLIIFEIKFGQLTEKQILQRFKDRLKKDKNAGLPKIYYIYKKYWQPMTEKRFIIENDHTLAGLRKKINNLI